MGAKVHSSSIILIHYTQRARTLVGMSLYDNEICTLKPLRNFYLSLEKFHNTFGALDKHLLGGFDALTLGGEKKEEEEGTGQPFRIRERKKTLIHTSSIVRSSAGRVLFEESFLVYFAESGVTYILIHTHVHTHTTQSYITVNFGGGGGIDTPNRVLTFHNWENVC